MSVLKSEIEQYLLENNFSLVYNSEFLFTYTHNIYKGHNVELLDIPEHKHVRFDLEHVHPRTNNTIKFIYDFNVTKLDDVKFLLSNSSGSPIVNYDLYD